MTATTKLIEKKRTNEMHVVIVDGKEVGTIARYNSRSAWSAMRGIGAAAVTVGTTTWSKAKAIDYVTGVA